jgi:hypothetical protein
MSKIQVNEIVNHFDTGAPDCPKGLTVTGFTTFTGGSSFSGDVSIDGTLTYEDVTNIDSVGIVTARSGVHYGTVGSGVTISAVGDGTNLGFLVNGSERARIDSSGRFGIGTPVPASKLHVANSSSAEIELILDPGDSSSEVAYINSYRTNAPLGFKAGDTERMRIDSSGRLLIGTSASSGSNTNLEVDGGVIANGSHVESIAGSSSFDKKITFAQKGAILVNINFCLGPTSGDSTRNIYSFGLMIPFNGGTLYVPIEADLTSSHVGNFTISSGGATGVLRIQKSAGSDGRQCTFRVDCLSTADINVAVADF